MMISDFAFHRTNMARHLLRGVISPAFNCGGRLRIASITLTIVVLAFSPEAFSQSAASPQEGSPTPALETKLSPTVPAKTAAKPPVREAQSLPSDTGNAPMVRLGQNVSLENATQPTPGIEATSNPLKITLTPSETPLKIGSTSNIAATIQNISNKPVRVELNTMQLTTHSIVASSTSLCVMAMTPNYNFYMNPEVVLQPQDQVSVLFNLSQSGRFGASTEELEDASGTAPSNGAVKSRISKSVLDAVRRSCDAGWMGPIKRALDFSPGNYDYFLTGYFSLCMRPTDTACQLPMRAISLSATFPVGIDQTSIIIFAVVGGWLALLVVTFNDAKKKGAVLHAISSGMTPSSGLRGLWERLTTSDGVQGLIKFVIRAFGVAILSAAFTIVSSRLSDTQLPVKITILDAWGAMTIGFISFFIGQKFIIALANWGGSSKSTGSDDRHTKPPASGA